MCVCVCARAHTHMVRAGAIGAGLPAGSGFSTLEQVTTLFSVKGAVLAGWTHYIAFDLFVGRHIVADSIEHGMMCTVHSAFSCVVCLYILKS